MESDLPSHVSTILSDLESEFEQKITLVDVTISESAAEFIIEYPIGGLANITVHSCQVTFAEVLNLPLRVSAGVDTSLFRSQEFQKLNRMRLVVPAFLIKSEVPKSDARYLRSQIPFTYLAPCLAGTSAVRT